MHANDISSLVLSDAYQKEDLRKVGAHPDCWYPVAWQSDLKPGCVIGAHIHFLATLAKVPSQRIVHSAEQNLDWGILLQ